MAEAPRSVVLNLFGDYLRYAAGGVKLAELTELMQAFGIGPATVRVTMSRLKKEGWFSTHKEGRQTVYRLSDDMTEVLNRGRQRIFRRRASSWTGRWTMVIYQVPESERTTRDQLRKQLAWLGFGQMSPSTWLSPHDLRQEAKDLALRYECARVDSFWCGSVDVPGARMLARRCWDLEALGRDYQLFLRSYEHFDSGECGTPEGKLALVERMRLTEGFRRFPFRDPELPDELQPCNWPGPAASRLFNRLHERLGVEANTYVENVLGRPLMAGSQSELM
jgi:phenylacetic acid degradation operon negative regulatory protein